MVSLCIMCGWECRSSKICWCEWKCRSSKFYRENYFSELVPKQYVDRSLPLSRILLCPRHSCQGCDLEAAVKQLRVAKKMHNVLEDSDNHKKIGKSLDKYVCCDDSAPFTINWVVNCCIFFKRVETFKRLVQYPKRFEVIDQRDAIRRLCLSEGSEIAEMMKTFVGIPKISLPDSFYDWAMSQLFGPVLSAFVNHSKVDINFIRGGHVVHRFTQLHRIISGGPYRPGRHCAQLLVHPDINVNKTDYFGRSPVFNIVCPLLYPVDDEQAASMKIYLEDERVTLAVRDNFGKTVYDYITEAAALKTPDAGHFWFWPDYGRYINEDGDVEAGIGAGLVCQQERDLALLQYAEKLRLRWAKQKVKILKDWSPCTHGKNLPGDVLTNHVLPFVADILSPIEALGGGSLE